MLFLVVILLLLVAVFAASYIYKRWQTEQDQFFGQSRELERRENSLTAQYSNILSKLSEIDRAILSNSSFEHMIELVLPCLSEFVSCSLAAVTQLDKKLTNQSSVMAVTMDGARINCTVTLDKSLRRILNHNPDGYLLEPPEQHPSLKSFFELGAAQILVMPIYKDAKLAAVLLLGFSSEIEISEVVRQLSRYFADRLGVALTSVLREKSLYYQEYFDEITSLPNRRSCSERLSLEISRANRNKTRVGIIHIGLNGFREINDAATYAGGGAVLKQVAERLLVNLRESDFVTRFGNDEFVVILPDVGRDENLGKVAEKLIHALYIFYTYQEHRYFLNSSVGISIYPNDGHSVDTLLQNADAASVRSKTKGAGHYMFYEEQINLATSERLALERDLRKALQGDELFLLYQPQIDLRKEAIVGVEALVRWQHPTRGVIHPLEFIAIAEESDLIERVGAYVRRVACLQYLEWEARGIAPERIALNISSKELMRNSFAADFLTLLLEVGVQPTSIELEITESLLLDISGDVSSSLHLLRRHGVRVAIDDFGTGYSSLSYLVDLPFDVLKIDRLFVAEIGKPSGRVEIVSVIIDMAHRLRKTICAEGIENKVQLEFLKDHGCETAQGYFLSRPISAEDFEQFSSEWKTNERQSSHSLDQIAG